MLRFLTRAALVLIVAALIAAGTSATASAQKKKQVPMGPYFQTLRPEKTIADAVGRGKKLFNDLGCAGCHPRGGTIGGTARAVDGSRVPVPIPALRGAALHYPRLSMTNFVANIGIMNDL
ncbi:MAG: hypothetical protein ACE5JS_02755 [Nitrospinota bacterium]